MQYTDELDATIGDAQQLEKRILAIQSHPTGYPPTADDCVSALNHGYSLGVVCGHNGTV